MYIYACRYVCLFVYAYEHETGVSICVDICTHIYNTHMHSQVMTGPSHVLYYGGSTLFYLGIHADYIAQSYRSTYIYIHIHIYIYMCVYVCECKHTHMYMYKYIHMYITDASHENRNFSDNASSNSLLPCISY